MQVFDFSDPPLDRLTMKIGDDYLEVVGSRKFIDYASAEFARLREHVHQQLWEQSRRRVQRREELMIRKARIEAELGRL